MTSHRITITETADPGQVHVQCGAPGCYLNGNGYDVRSTAAPGLAVTHEATSGIRAEAEGAWPVLGAALIAFLVVGFLVGYLFGAYL